MKPRALVVDDSLTVRMDVGEALEGAGFDVVLCAALEPARAALARSRTLGRGESRLRPAVKWSCG